jgi:hypothetical protein
MKANWFLLAATVLNLGAAGQAWCQGKPLMVTTMIAYAVAAFCLAWV